MASLDDLVQSCVDFANDEDDCEGLIITIKPAPLGGRFGHAEVINNAGEVASFKSDFYPLNPPPPPDNGGN